MVEVTVALADDTGRFQADRVRLGNQVAAHLRDMIMSGQLAPGEKLRLHPLSSSLNVSTTPVREALLLLESEGLVKSEPHRGFVVKELSPRDILDLFELHAFIAGRLAERSATTLSETELAQLAAIDEDIQRSASDGDGVRVEELNYRFHRIINRAGASPILSRFLAQTTHYVPRRFYGQIDGWIEATSKDHGPIVEALRARDASKAGELTEEHIRGGGVLLVEHLNRTGRWRDSDVVTATHARSAVRSDGVRAERA